MNSRKYPRTTQEAFGPYTSSKITEVDPPYDFWDRAIIGAAIATFAGLALARFLGVL